MSVKPGPPPVIGAPLRLFTIADDLYFYDFEAARAARLTSTPGEEEEATFSPDGRLVAFVREHVLPFPMGNSHPRFFGFINATADPATRQVKVYVTIANREARLVAGLFASGRVVTREVKGAVAVPRAGVRRDDPGASYVLVVESGRVARCEVTVGAYDEVQSLVEITSGLEEGVLAIVGPVEGLQVGDLVDIVSREG